MVEKPKKSGIDIIGNASWGSHFCHFYRTRVDLIDILVPYFKTGLENNEFCIWITSEPLKIEDAERELKKVVTDLDDYIHKDQIEILDASQWYTKSGKFEVDKALEDWVEKENESIKRGFDGLRVTGNTFWLEERDWKNFAEYEEKINNLIGKYRMIAICSYDFKKFRAAEILDVFSNHQFALIKRGVKWEIIESSEHKRAVEEEHRLRSEIEANKEALKQSEERFTIFMDHFPGAAFIKDPNGRYIYVNKPYERLYGLAKEDVLGKTDAQIWPIQIAEQLMKNDQIVISEGCSLQTTESIIYSDGRTHIQMSYKFLVPKTNKLNFLGGFSIDVTEHLKTEKALIQEKEKFQEAHSKIKKLSEMLPICASCNKMRIDKGFWDQIELDIQDRSETELSYAICPECRRKLYPDLFDNNN